MRKKIGGRKSFGYYNILYNSHFMFTFDIELHRSAANKETDEVKNKKKKLINNLITSITYTTLFKIIIIRACWTLKKKNA